MFVDEHTIYVTGGINKKLNDISKEFYIYNPTENTACRMPDLHQIRYTHMSILADNKLFVMGGRAFGAAPKGILNHAEYFDLATMKWIKTSPMIRKRCTGHVFSYKNQVYVFGGYEGKEKGNERPREVERYDGDNNKWVALDFKIP